MRRFDSVQWFGLTPFLCSPPRFVCLQTQACLASISVVQSDFAEAQMKLAKVTGWLQVETDEGEREALEFAQQAIRRRHESLSATIDYFLKRLDDLGAFVGIFESQLLALCIPFSFFSNGIVGRSPCLCLSRVQIDFLARDKRHWIGFEDWWRSRQAFPSGRNRRTSSCRLGLSPSDLAATTLFKICLTIFKSSSTRTCLHVIHACLSTLRWALLARENRFSWVSLAASKASVITSTHFLQNCDPIDC